MSSNRLKSNPEKTQFKWLGGQQQLNKVNIINSINLLGSTVNLQSGVVNLGVTIDGPLTMRDLIMCCESAVRHPTNFVSCVSSESRFQLRRVGLRLSSLHLFQVDFCNSLLIVLNDELTNKLQSLGLLRSEARIVLRKRKFDPITDDLSDLLHWLPIRQRIKYKLGVLVYKCIHG